MIQPLLKLNRRLMKEENISFLSEHYDPLFLGLKIIDIIMENTTVLSISEITGISREGIFEKIEPFMNQIDEKKMSYVKTALKKKLVNKIIDTLISPGREKHQIEYIDYASQNLGWKTEPYQLLYLDTTPDDEVNVIIDMKMVNIFTNLLEMKIEDLQLAILSMQEKQIKRGDYKNAIISADKSRQISLMYMKNIRDIIYKTKRKYQAIDWLSEYPKKLSDARVHIEECIEKYKNMQKIMLNTGMEILNESDEAYFFFHKLENKLKQSVDILHPLINIINDARNTFEIQSSNILISERIHAFSIESDIFPAIFNILACQVEEFLKESAQYLSSCKIPPITDLCTVINLFVEDYFKKKNKEENQARIRIKRRRRLEEVGASMPEKYNMELRKKVIAEVHKILESLTGEPILLENLIKKFKDLQFNDREIEYLVLFILGKFASEDFESRFSKIKIKVDLSGEYFSKYGFEGANYSIQKN